MGQDFLFPTSRVSQNVEAGADVARSEPDRPGLCRQISDLAAGTQDEDDKASEIINASSAAVYCEM